MAASRGTIGLIGGAMALLSLCTFVGWQGDSALVHPATAQRAPIYLNLASSIPTQEDAFIAALRGVSRSKASQLSSRLANHGSAPEARMEFVVDVITHAIDRNLNIAPKVATDDIDAILFSTRQIIQAMESASPNLCKASAWVDMEGADAREIGDFMMDNGFSGTQAYEATLVLGTQLLHAIANTRDNPARHGPLTNGEETALQGAAFTLMMNPNTMAAIAANGDETLLRNVDACNLGHAVLRQVARLSEPTRGKLWAAAVNDELDELALF